MPSHISLQRKERATGSIKKKIAILERYAIEGVPEGGFAPANLTEFRLWEDSAADVTKLGSPNTMDKPHNTGLKLRVQELINEISKKKNRRKARSNHDQRRAELRDKNKLITDLTNQWHSSRHECDRAQQNERRQKNRVAELQRDNGELTKKLRAVVPLRPTA